MFNEVTNAPAIYGYPADALELNYS